MNFLKKLFKSTNFALNNTSCHCEENPKQSHWDFVIRSGLPRGKARYQTVLGKAPRNDTIARDDNNMAKFVNKKELWLLTSIIIIGAFLRFWRLEERQYLTYDQSRDYIIIKRIIVDKKFTLVGPTVLAPGVYLPPFYYYSLAPFLYLFNFHLIGPDIYTAFLGIAAIIVFYFLVRDLFGLKTAIFSSLLFSLNPYLIQASRHAWNPNTIYFFTLLFAFSFERYFFKKSGKYLIVAAFSISWALNLHYTVLVFLPLLLFMFSKEFISKKFSKNLLLSLLVFFCLVSPIFIFELRHNFPNFRGIMGFALKQTNSSQGFFLIERGKVMFFDYLKMPLTLISGLSQSKNLTINPSHILLFDKTSLQINAKIFFAILIIISSLVLLFKGKEERRYQIIIAFLMFGFSIRLLFPQASFYFYHYTFLFPFIFLLISLLYFEYFKKYNNIIFPLIFTLIVVILALYPQGIRNEIKTEKYFLTTCSIMAKATSPGEKIAVAANLKDLSRWDHNALEYRYFLEAFYRFPVAGWDVGDYKEANVLYLVDEGSLKEPLKLGGMEVEAFSPNKIEKIWKVDTGQTIYKMTR